MAELPGEASCPICREYFREPVSIHCGHHFCRPCIERRWEWPTAEFACPRCREAAPQRSLRPSRELERVLEIARRLSRGAALAAQEEEEEEEEEGCQKHREPLEFFCKEDGALLCAICRESRAHRAHTVLPLPEAVRDYEEQIQARLRTLEESRDKLLQLREAEMRRNWEYLEQTEAERRRVLARFRGLGLVLEELCGRLLARLRRLERGMAAAQEEKVTRLTEEISRLESRARELRERRRQPARAFLQDIQSTLSSPGAETPAPPPPPPPGPGNWEIRLFREENSRLGERLSSVREILEFELPEKMPVTLDPSTAHPRLRVAPDGSSVRWERPRDPPGPDPDPDPDPGPGPGPDPGPDPDPDPDPCPDPGPGPDPSVLGREGVTGGRRCWDVQVAPEGSWALGVVTETPGSGAETPGNGAETPGSGAETLEIGAETPGIGAETLESGAETPGRGSEPPWNGSEPPRRGSETPRRGLEPPGNESEPPWSSPEPPGSAEGQLWSMGQCQGQFWALTSLERIPLFPRRAPSRVRVALDYERGRVAFFDADERSLIFAFPGASFRGRSVRPWFLVWGEGSGLALCP